MSAGEPVAARSRPRRPGFLKLPENGHLWYGQDMPATPEIDAFDRGIRPLLRIVLPEKAEAVLSFRPAPELLARIEELAGKSTEGQLTEMERAEYAGYVRANKFVAILQRQARQLSGSAS
ncbi:MAG TPA: hypothetical protein VN765_05040 [Candidatus Acidoferrum sp.]|nr:hypothetical protein [Candidatus Acidoferrum sp.]